LQTIAAAKLFKPSTPITKKERVELEDGDFLDINWSTKSRGPWVCVFHGLAGSLQSTYAAGIFKTLESNGMRPVFMHWRGCSGEPNRLARSYHSGATDDIGTMVNLVKKRYPNEKVYAIGYSLGANALLKYLGEQSTNCVLSGAATVCPPLVLNVGADKLNTGLTRGYQRYLINLMREQHENKRKAKPELDLPTAGTELNNFWKFDNELTAPLHGFADVHDYYKRCSARQFLIKISIPTHIVYALDDPFFTTAVLPTENELAANVTLELSDYGGHVGFIGDKTHKRWIDHRIAAVLTAMQHSQLATQ